jgi:uncharacterized membrane protein
VTRLESPNELRLDNTPLDNNTVTSLVHLYRGELGRMVSYRVRLDTTTNWAIVTNAGLTTVALSNPDVSHVVFLFAMLLTFFFLQLEARRFRVYELSHARVRLLERYFYPKVLQGEVQEKWRDMIVQSLLQPQHEMSYLHAVGWRLRRNYLWIYAGLLFVWVIKLGAFQNTSSDVIAQARLGNLPGWLVLVVLLGLYGSLIVLAWWAGRYRLEDD